VINNLYWSSCKLPFILVRLKMNFSGKFKKKLKYQISWKSVQWEPSCPKRTDMAKPIFAFHNLANVPKNKRKNRFFYILQLLLVCPTWISMHRGTKFLERVLTQNAISVLWAVMKHQIPLFFLLVGSKPA